jgi:hypothetical protein
MTGTTIWDGKFSDKTASDLSKWSFGSPVGAYQYYIHGTGAVDKYVGITGNTARITIDSTAKWNSDMWRTELIPETKAAINKGKVFYHFSMKTSATNAPSATNEHQIAFFESHFTEMKYGWISGEAGTKNTNLQWMVGGQSKWKAELVADETHNVAYEIDFDGGEVTFWHSTGSAPLAKTAGPFKASCDSNGADWHVGVLRLPRQGNDGTGAEDYFFSNVYIESGDLTTAVGGSVEAAKPAASAASTKVAAETPVASSTAAAETVVASSTATASTAAASTTAAAAPVETPVASSTKAAAAPSATAGAGSKATLPEKFTLKQFIAWLKETSGQN